MKFLLGYFCGVAVCAGINAFLSYKEKQRELAREKLKQNQEIIKKVDMLNDHLAKYEEWNECLKDDSWRYFTLTYDFLERDTKIREVLSQLPKKNG